MEARIGVFVFVATAGLIALAILFGGNVRISAKQRYITVKFVNAPGVAVGVPVRKNGIRIGSVAQVAFDNRPKEDDEPEGVLITLGIDEPYKLTQDSLPMIQRALIGDTTIEILTSAHLLPEPIKLSESLDQTMVIRGEVSADPNAALGLATEALSKVGTTLNSIDEAAKGVAALTKKAESLEGFIDTWDVTGKKLGELAEKADRIVGENEKDIKPTVSALKRLIETTEAAFDVDTRMKLKKVIDRANSITEAIDTDVLVALKPLAADLGGTTSRTPVTNAGQVLLRLNAMVAQLGLLTRTLSDPDGKLNTNGSLQKMLTDPALYSEATSALRGANDIVRSMRPAVKNLTTFSEKVAADPSIISRGALKP
jgi:phospholipid/cholesterol/gamma-HCH transport system substrate-binding protein